MRRMNYCVLSVIALVLLLVSSTGDAADQRQGGSFLVAGGKVRIGGAQTPLDTVTQLIDLSQVWSDSLTIIVKQDSGMVRARKVVMQRRDYFKGINNITDDSLSAWSTADTIQKVTRKTARMFKGYGTHMQLRFRTTVNDTTSFGAAGDTTTSTLYFGVIGTSGK